MEDMQLASYSVMELLAFHANITEELRKRQILRTANNPVADYAENLGRRAFGWMAAPNSEKGYDAKDKEGRRYQIKARRIASGRMPSRSSAIRKLEENHFDSLLVIVFTHDFLVHKAALMPASVVREKAFFQEHVNAWILPLRDTLWEHAGVQDVTNLLRQAQDQDHG